jgi:hypothetical protein
MYQPLGFKGLVATNSVLKFDTCILNRSRKTAFSVPASVETPANLVIPADTNTAFLFTDLDLNWKFRIAVEWNAE